MKQRGLIVAASVLLVLFSIAPALAGSLATSMDSSGTAGLVKVDDTQEKERKEEAKKAEDEKRKQEEIRLEVEKLREIEQRKRRESEEAAREKEEKDRKEEARRADEQRRQDDERRQQERRNEEARQREDDKRKQDAAKAEEDRRREEDRQKDEARRRDDDRRKEEAGRTDGERRKQEEIRLEVEKRRKIEMEAERAREIERRRRDYPHGDWHEPDFGRPHSETVIIYAPSPNDSYPASPVYVTGAPAIGVEAAIWGRVMRVDAGDLAFYVNDDAYVDYARPGWEPFDGLRVSYDPSLRPPRPGADVRLVGTLTVEEMVLQRGAYVNGRYHAPGYILCLPVLRVTDQSDIWVY